MTADLPTGPVGFVMGGGGGLGAVQVGMLQGLSAAGITPDFLIGTSVGALNGAVVASHPEDHADRLADLWLSLQREDIFTGGIVSALWRLGRTRTHAVDTGALTRLAQRALDVSTFEELALPLGVVTTNLVTGEDHVVTQGELLPSLLASSAIPGVFPPVVIDGQPMVDGGLLANIPVAQSRAVGAARTLIVLDCTVPMPMTPSTDVVEMISVTTRLQSRDQLRNALPSVADRSVVISLPAPASRQTSVFDFAQTVALIDDARRATTEFLSELVLDGPGVYGDPLGRYVPRWESDSLDAGARALSPA